MCHRRLNPSLLVADTLLRCASVYVVHVVDTKVPIMRRVVSLLLSLALLVPLAVIAPVGVSVAVALPTLKVAVVRSTIAEGTRSYIGGAYLNGAAYDARVDGVIKTLNDSGRFATVTKIGDAELSSLATLETFDVVVFPRTLALNSVERQTLLTYTARGGGVVGSFGLSRWDYNAAYTYGYMPYLGMTYAPGLYTWPPSSDALKVWEWGNISEMYNAKFKNDDLMGDGYKVVGKPVSTHPILQGTAADLGVGSLSMTAKAADYNEVVYSVAKATNVTPLLTYYTIGNASSTDDVDNGLMAAWATDYYFGRFVYFGFQLHDLCRDMTYYGDAATLATAEALLVNSVAWAGSSTSMGYTKKAPVLGATAWFSGGKLWINESVVNAGNVPLRGALKVEVYNPAKSRVYSGQAYNNLCPLPPGGSYVHASWQPSIGSPHMAGTWTVKMTYDYYDYFRGGTASAVRSVYMYSTGTSMKQGAYSAQIVVGGAIPAAPAHEQIAGDSRYDTGIELSKEGWPTGVSESGAIIIATGTSYPDALAAAPLAGALDAPVLLVPPTGLTLNLQTELERLYEDRETAQVVVVGGENAVPPAVVTAVQGVIEASGASVETTRLAGTSRWGTAQAIAREVGAPTSGTFADTAFIVSGQNYPDALAASPLAARAGIPILLTQKTALPAETLASLSELGIKHVVIVGGVGVVSMSVETALETAGYRVAGVSDNDFASVDTRLHGASRYETAMRCSDYSVALGGFDDSTIFLATGKNWPDALALAPVAGKRGYPLMLLDGNEIQNSLVVANFLRSRVSDPPGITFVGGAGAIDDYVRGQVRVALGL